MKYRRRERESERGEEVGGEEIRKDLDGEVMPEKEEEGRTGITISSITCAMADA